MKNSKFKVEEKIADKLLVKEIESLACEDERRVDIANHQLHNLLLQALDDSGLIDNYLISLTDNWVNYYDDCGVAEDNICVKFKFGKNRNLSIEGFYHLDSKTFDAGKLVDRIIKTAEVLFQNEKELDSLLQNLGEDSELLSIERGFNEDISYQTKSKGIDAINYCYSEPRLHGNADIKVTDIINTTLKSNGCDYYDIPFYDTSKNQLIISAGKHLDLFIEDTFENVDLELLKANILVLKAIDENRELSFIIT